MIRRDLILGAGALISAGAVGASAASPSVLRFSTAVGAGGVPLNVVEAGRTDGPSILFVHGMSQSYLSWAPQLKSALAERFRLIAFDLRGHGNSGKPWRPEDYAGTKIWADDVHAVIDHKSLARPTLVAWSFGGAVAMDYVRHYGVEGLNALNMVGTLGGLVAATTRPTAASTRAYSEAPLRQSPDLDENIDGFRRAAHGLSAHLSKADQDIAFYTGLMQTGLVRRAIGAGLKLDNRDLVSAVSLPMLFTVGALDAFVSLEDARATVRELPKATLSFYPDTGHFVSVEAAARFDQELATFAVGGDGRG